MERPTAKAPGAFHAATRLLVRMGRQGYVAGAPSLQTQDQDRAVAHNTPCPRCWGPMRYLPFTRAEDRSYRAFAYCAACDHSEEF